MLRPLRKDSGLMVVCVFVYVCACVCVCVCVCDFPVFEGLLVLRLIGPALPMIKERGI